MKTRTDIQDGEQLTITVLVTDINEWTNHNHIAQKVICEDVDGNKIPLTVFHNNDAAEFDWDIGRWYKLKNARGNIHEGEKQLNPSYDLGIVLLDEPPEEARSQDTDSGPTASEATTVTVSSDDSSNDPPTGNTTADGGAGLMKTSLSSGNHLLHFPFGDIAELEVHEYRLTIPGGLHQDDDLDGGPLGFTARAASRYRYRSGVPVTTNGPLKLYTVEKLTGELAVDGYSVQPQHIGTKTLETRNFDHREPLRELVKQDVKAALRGKYDVSAINSIIEFNPYRKADSGDFTASREYGCRIWVDPDGSVICGVSVGFHLQSTFSAAEYVQRGYDIPGVNVEHDTGVYDRVATGTVRRLSDTGYTDHVDDMGSSTAEYHRKTGNVDAEIVDSLAAGDPLMADIDYGQWEGLQALEFCRIVPTTDQLKLVDKTFHDEFQEFSRLLPDERFSVAQSFAKSIGTTPSLGLEPDTTPTNRCYEELSINTRTPNLRFANGQTAPYGKVGLDNHGVYQPPESFKVLAVYPDRFRTKAQQFLTQIVDQLEDYEAPINELRQETYELGVEFNYHQVAQSHANNDIDGVLVVVPDPEWVGNQSDIDDPYPEFKRMFGQRKLPSQMVTYSNLENTRYNGNIAAGLIAKTGGIPWRIHEVPGGADVFIGLDVTYDHDTGQHLGASANIVMADGTILASQSISLQQGETFEVDDIVGILKDLLRVYVDQEGHVPNHLIIHRDGQFYLDVEDLVKRLEAASEFFPQFDLVEIRKSGNPRIAEYTGKTFEVANKGIAFAARNADHAYLTTTGKPELKPGNRLGTPRPIRVVKRHGSTDLGTLTKQVYWLSEAHVASISRSTRLPITTYYADQCAEHARKGYMLNDELIRGIPYV